MLRSVNRRCCVTMMLADNVAEPKQQRHLAESARTKKTRRSTWGWRGAARAGRSKSRSSGQRSQSETGICRLAPPRRRAASASSLAVSRLHPTPPLMTTTAPISVYTPMGTDTQPTFCPLLPHHGPRRAPRLVSSVISDTPTTKTRIRREGERKSGKKAHDPDPMITVSIRWMGACFYKNCMLVIRAAATGRGAGAGAGAVAD
ncbi:hypothetical protein EDB87DRAFT_149161 [Lactarius vividus]|nr:hypothetical protein EDB87DRAFT_149161 [Lactarius vividus]